METKRFTCKKCGKVKKLWTETVCYKEKLCPKCLDETYTQAELLRKVIS